MRRWCRDVKSDLRSLREGCKRTFVTEYFDEQEPREIAAAKNSNTDCVMSTAALIGALIDLSNHKYLGACSTLSNPSAAEQFPPGFAGGEPMALCERVSGAGIASSCIADKIGQLKNIDSYGYTNGCDQLDGTGQGVRKKRKAAQTAKDALYARVLQRELNCGASKRPRAKRVPRSHSESMTCPIPAAFPGPVLA